MIARTLLLATFSLLTACGGGSDAPDSATGGTPTPPPATTTPTPSGPLAITAADHYHGLPEGLINRLGEGPDGATDMIAGGFAADGFPFYLRYGYSDPNDPQSGLVTVRGSWVLRPGIRPNGPGGPYDGTFREDWEFVEGSGDLDECNGRFGVTPEHPAGTCHYYITDDYPYIPRCVSGTPDGSFRVRR